MCPRDLELDQQQESVLEEEKKVCSALISYLTRLQTSMGGATPAIGESSPASSTGSPEDSLSECPGKLCVLYVRLKLSQSVSFLYFELDL